MQGKLDSFLQYAGVECPPENLICFNKTTESLVPLLELIDADNPMFINDNLEERAGHIIAEIPGFLNGYSEEDEEAILLAEQIEMFMEEALEEEKEKQEKLKK